MSSAFRSRGSAVLLIVSMLTACTDGDERTAPTATVAEGESVSLTHGGGLGAQRQEITDAVAALDAAWNAGDANAYAAVFAADARLIAPTGALFPSRDAVRALHVGLFAGPFRGSSRATTSLEIRFLTGTIAVADRVGDVTNYAFLPPGVTPTVPGVLRQRERQVFEKRDGTWTVTFAQLTSVAPGVPVP